MGCPSPTATGEPTSIAAAQGPPSRSAAAQSTTVPGTSAQSAPQSDTQSATPQSAIAQSATPQSATPQNIIAQNATPQSDTLQGALDPGNPASDPSILGTSRAQAILGASSTDTSIAARSDAPDGHLDGIALRSAGDARGAASTAGDSPRTGAESISSTGEAPANAAHDPFASASRSAEDGALAANREGVLAAGDGPFAHPASGLPVEEALAEAFRGAAPAGLRGLPSTPSATAAAGGSAPGSAGDASTNRGDPLQLPRPLPTAIAAPGTALRAGNTAGGSLSWSYQAGAHSPAAQTNLPPAGTHRPAPPADLTPTGGVTTHDKLWVPDPTQTSTGTGDMGGLLAPTADTTSSQAATAPTGDPEAPLIDYGVGLQQAIETLHGTIQIAARQGLSQARIALQPEELGEIRIHLTQTAQGLLARVTAETPAAAGALAAAHAELRQSLSTLGINLTSLSIGHHDPAAAHQEGSAPESGGPGHPAAGGDSSRNSRSSRSAGTELDGGEVGQAGEESAPPSLPRSSGALVDVLV